MKDRNQKHPTTQKKGGMKSKKIFVQNQQWKSYMHCKEQHCREETVVATLFYLTT